MTKELERLKRAEELICEIAAESGLEWMEQEFDIVPAQKMLEIMAYRLPVNFSHWSFGRDYEVERTKYDHGYAVPYEVVFNSDPCRAYLMETNPFPIQVMIIAHVYAHNDFMKNNRYFRHSRRDMITSASEAASRFRKYEEDFGRDAVEKLIDSGMALQWNIDPDKEHYLDTEEETRERLYGWAKSLPLRGAYDDLLPPRKEVTQEEKRKLRKRTPPEPTVDILGYVAAHSPRRLQEWEQDILGVIRGQAQYFLPYRRTKIMNEGWATYWHEKIMHRLFQEKFLTPEEHGYYNLYNARVKAHHPRSLNPYLLGYTMFRNIEDRWNRGRFGEAFEECNEAEQKRSWDAGLMQGLRKIFDVRRTYTDAMFLADFLNKDVVDELNLYLYLEKDRGDHYDIVVEETDWTRVKDLMVKNIMNWGIPRIMVRDGNYKNSHQLYLRHEFEGLPLDDGYARKTLEHIFSLWERPVYLETREIQRNTTQKKIYRADDHGVATITDAVRV